MIISIIFGTTMAQSVLLKRKDNLLYVNQKTVKGVLYTLYRDKKRQLWTIVNGKKKKITKDKWIKL